MNMVARDGGPEWTMPQRESKAQTPGYKPGHGGSAQHAAPGSDAVLCMTVGGEPSSEFSSQEKKNPESVR